MKRASLLFLPLSLFSHSCFRSLLIHSLTYLHLHVGLRYLFLISSPPHSTSLTFLLTFLVLITKFSLNSFCTFLLCHHLIEDSYNTKTCDLSVSNRHARVHTRAHTAYTCKQQMLEPEQQKHFRPLISGPNAPKNSRRLVHSHVCHVIGVVERH